MIQAFLPKPDADPTKVSGKGAYISVDDRPVSPNRGLMKKLMATYKSYLQASIATGRSIANPFIQLSIRCAPRSYDPNVTPSKDEVMFSDGEGLQRVFEDMCRAIYSVPTEELQSPASALPSVSRSSIYGSRTGAYNDGLFQQELGNQEAVGRSRLLLATPPLKTRQHTKQDGSTRGHGESSSSATSQQHSPSTKTSQSSDTQFVHCILPDSPLQQHVERKISNAGTSSRATQKQRTKLRHCAVNMARTRTLSNEGAAVYVSLNSWPGEEEVPPVARPVRSTDVNPWSIAKLAATHTMPVRSVRGGSSSPSPHPHRVRCYALDKKTGRTVKQGNANSLANVAMERQEFPSPGSLGHLADSRRMFTLTMHSELDTGAHDDIPVLQGPPAAVTPAVQDVPATQGGCHLMHDCAPPCHVSNTVREAATSGRMALTENRAMASETSPEMTPSFIYHTPPPSAGRAKPMARSHNPPYSMPTHANPKRKLPVKDSTARKPRKGPESVPSVLLHDAESLHRLEAPVTLRYLPNTDGPLRVRQFPVVREDTQFQPTARAAPAVLAISRGPEWSAGTATALSFAQ